MHQIPLKVFNSLPRNYEVIDMIISTKDTNGLRVLYESTTKHIPSFSKDRNLGYLKMFPSNFDKVPSLFNTKVNQL